MLFRSRLPGLRQARGDHRPLVPQLLTAAGEVLRHLAGVPELQLERLRGGRCELPTDALQLRHCRFRRRPCLGACRVQVGIRDFGLREREFVEKSNGRVQCFYDQHLRDRQFKGGARGSWRSIATDIVKALPKDVYISFDIDGLTPDHCPNTGTPVPGGLTFPEMCHLLETLAKSGRRVIGFDLCEVSPGPNDGEWNANVGARTLYKLLGCTLRSRGLLR